ncbi:lipopolysaccharide transport periplasmic protein LptA [Seleniivibrio woodruffii]|uniref:Lipopolysaccharide export system protein LptA n=1 Tax=Seleniivibrio woodruffii TaxID=1078050 RepID=A0A4R1K937_9BACT|nr:lipopolysaccharide transport periplasmic protein LptA [Seleniivibrio woodruffii]TCK60854.1 lipopolysaccharide export system protein LptA [Seleniivibrio woodruffii]TVZ36484.1 lipopolysaccharide export system protein LptA [Seleniivibrio woodruffii]
MFRSLITNSLVVLLLATALTASAAEGVVKPGLGKKPIKILSDYMKYTGSDNTSRFSGNVVVTDGEMRVSADNMDVTFDKSNNVKEINAQGNVKIEKEGLLALSDRAKLFAAEEMAVLSSNVRVWQGDNYLEGEKVTLYNENNRIFVDRGTNNRVKIIIAPKEAKK